MHAAIVPWSDDETPTPSGVQPIVRSRYVWHDVDLDEPEIEVRLLSHREVAELALLELAIGDELLDDDEPTREYLVPSLRPSDFAPQVIGAWIALELESQPPPAPGFADPVLESWLR